MKVSAQWWCFFVPILAACPDQNLGRFNSPPEIVITSHAQDLEANEGYTLSFRAQVSDVDDPLEDLMVTWYSGSDIICETAPPDETGAILCDITIGPTDTDIVAEVIDPDTAAASAIVHVTVLPTEPPSGVILSPLATDKFYSSHKVSFSALLVDAEDPADQLTASWESDLDGPLDVDTVPNATGEISGATLLSEGQHFIELHVFDTTGKTTTESTVITVGVPNTPPSCAITAPDSGDSGQTGSIVVFEGQVDDVDVPANWLEVEWHSDKDGLIGTSSPDSSGAIAFPYSALSANAHVITMTATDEVGEDCSTWILYAVGTPPILTINEPISGTSFNEGDAILFDATVSDNEDLPTELDLSWTSDIDGEFATYGADSSGAVRFTTSTLSGGTHVITATATDTAGLTALAYTSISINAVPSAPVVSISPDPAGTEEDLAVSIDSPSVDPEGASITYTYTWYKNGVVSSASTSASLPASATARGEAWSVEVTPNDGVSDGPAGTASLTIANTAPELASATLGPIGATTSDALTCTPGTSSDIDGDTVSYTYAWTINGSSASSTASTLASTEFVKSDDIICIVTPTDGSDAGTPVASGTLTIANTPPEVTSANLTPTQARESTTLTCAAGTTSDDDGDTVIISYSWTIDGIGISTTSSTLTGTDFDKGDEVICIATPNDGTDNGTAVSSSSVTVSNTAPTVASASLTPTSADVDDTLTCTSGSTGDDDGDSVSVTISWNVNGAGISTTGSTLDSSDFSKTDKVVCIATPSDGTDDGTPVASNEVIIANAPPVLDDVTLGPDPATTNDDLSCAPGTASDSDGDSITYSYAWTVNSASISASTATLAASAIVKDDKVFCTVTPNDGTIEGSAVDSSLLTIANTPPTATSPTLTPTAPTESDTLNCAVGSTSDDDGDTVTTTIGWTVNGSVIATTGSSLTSSDFGKGDDIACFVTPYDGTENGSNATSSTVTIVNLAPVLDDVSLTPSDPVEASTLTCAPGTSSDADGDPISFSYLWTVGSTELSVTADTLTGTDFDKGDSVFCTVTPNDGYEDGSPVDSSSVTIGNTAPVLSSVSLTPVSADVTNTLTCTPGSSSDVDGDTVSYSYAWKVNTTTLSHTGTTLAGTAVIRGDVVSCTVTPTDGTDPGLAVTSATVTIGNALPSLTSASISPDPALASDELTCTSSGFFDPDGDSDYSTFSWTIGSTVVGTGSTLSGAFVGGETVVCTVTPKDGYDSGTEVSDSITIANTPPVLSSVSLTPTTAAEGSTLTCTPGTATDDDLDTVTFSTAWTVGGSPISATSTTLTGADFDKSDDVLCTVTPNDATIDGDPVDSNTVTIGNTAPSMVSVSLSPTTVYTDTTLTATATASDVDTADTISFSYEWYVGSTKISATGKSIDGNAWFDKGEGVYVVVTPSDGTDSGTSLTSSTTMVQNSAPEAPVVIITPPGPVETFDDMLCEVDTESFDADGDAVSYSVSWFKGSTAWTGSTTTTTLTGDTIDVSDLVEDDVWTCVLTPNDGTTDGTDGSMDATIVPCTGRTSTCPAASCLDILTDGSSIGDDNYYLDPTSSGTAIQVYCDMTTDSGGWTLIAQGGFGNCGEWSGMSSSTNMQDTDGCSYLDTTVVQALAATSSEVLLQVNETSTSFGSWDSEAFSTNSKAIAALTTSTGTWHNGATWDNWTWSHTCTPTLHSGWPEMYHACGSSRSVHWLAYHRSMDHSDEASNVSATWVR